MQQQKLTMEGGSLTWGIRVIAPKKLQPELLHELHWDHPGIFQMKALARNYLWWPGLDKNLEVVVKSCVACQCIRQAPAVAPLHSWLWPTKPWQHVYVDFLGPFQGKWFMVTVDTDSKWPEVEEIPSTSVASTVALV